jgi:peptidoglycan/LPS O-acetylase OafA/YrhL
MASPHPSRFRPDIEGLRCIAVLAVLVFHLDPHWLPGGFQGVDMFFVISGYLITRLIRDQQPGFSFPRFYLRRFWRLFPALSATIGATVIAAYAVLSPPDYEALAGSALAAVFGVSNFYFFGHLDYFNDDTLVHPLLHTWSLGVEEQFYLFWPLLMVVAWRGNRLAALMPWLFGGAFLFNLVLAGIDPQFAFYMMPFRIFEFAAGASILMVEVRYGNSAGQPAIALVASLLGAGLLAAGFQFFDENRVWPGAAALLPVLGCVLLIFGGNWRPVARLVGNPVFCAIGAISYALYLVHWPVITLYRYWRVVPLSAAELAGLALACLAAAAALHIFIETPFREGRPSPTGLARLFDIRCFTFWRRLKVPLVGLGAVATVALAGSVWALDGLPGRVAKLRAQQGADQLSYAGDICAGSRSYRCILGDATSERIVYVIGDSHAGNLFSGLDGLFREQGVRGIALMDHGCLFLAGTTRFIKGVRDDSCARNIADAFAAAGADRAPVILAGNYSDYAGAIGPTGADAPLPPDSTAYYAFLRENLAESLRHLSAESRPVLLVSSAYNSGKDIARCLNRPGVDAGELLAGDCAPWSLARNREVSGRADAIIGEAARDFAGAVVLDPKLAFCGDEDGPCAVIDKGAFLMRDTTHLTNEGSRQLVEHFRDYLIRWLAGAEHLAASRS